MECAGSGTHDKTSAGILLIENAMVLSNSRIPNRCSVKSELLIDNSPVRRERTIEILSLPKFEGGSDTH